MSNTTFNCKDYRLLLECCIANTDEASTSNTDALLNAIERYNIEIEKNLTGPEKNLCIMSLDQGFSDCFEMYGYVNAFLRYLKTTEVGKSVINVCVYKHQ